jgi:glutamate/aspartate transport system permease protein
VRTTTARWAVRLGNLYVEIFRNVPLIVQMFLWFFVVPELLPERLGDWIKQMPPPWGSYVPAVLCLAIFTSVRVAEQVRAGINSLPRGQRMAGTAMGLTQSQTYRHVILPQALRIILPPLTSEFMNIIKNSSVALTIGLLELTGAGAGDAGVQLPRVRGVHRGDGDLPPDQPRRRARDARARERACACRA